MTAAIKGPIGYRQFHLEKICQANEGHKHNYDHNTIVIRGSLRVIYKDEVDGKIVETESRDYYQGEHIHIAKGKLHTIKALEDDTIYQCIFSHRDWDGQIIQTYIGNRSAYL